MQSLRLKSQRFRREREESWKQLEKLLRKIESGSLRSLNQDEITALPSLYRSTLSSLSAARATSLDQNVIEYLESLSTRAYYIIYGAQENLFNRFARFLRYDWPAAAKALWGETLVSTLVMFLGALVGFMLVQSNPDWFFSFLPESLAGNRTPATSTEDLRATLYDGGGDGLGIFATFLFSHNSKVAIFAFALGFAFCIPTILLMLYNGTILGAFFALFYGRGLGYELGGWLIIHGATEIFAIILAGAAGMHIGKTMAFPGRSSRLAATSAAGMRAGILMAGVIIMLFFAGLLEGFGRQLITHDITRYVIGIGSLTFWCLYFYGTRPDPDKLSAQDTDAP